MGPSTLPIGLALGSGVARGWAHIGVLRALARAGITPDIVCGTSIGALIGGIYLAGRIDALEAWARRLNKVRLGRLFDLQLGRGGLIAGRRILQAFDRELREQTIQDLPRRFACVTTEFGTGDEIWLRSGNLLDAARASYAVPGLFPPVYLDDRWLFDGALVNPVPVSVCRALGARIVIAVNLNGAGAGHDSADHGASSEKAVAATVTAMNGHYGARPDRDRARRASEAPRLLSVMSNCLQIVQDRLTRSRLSESPPDVTIAPKLSDIGLLQFDRAGESIAAGECAAELALGALTETLRKLRDGQGASSAFMDAPGGHARAR
jgi:NTE family protein